MNISRLLTSLVFVVAGLCGRALIDKLLSLQGGAVAVAGWAQLASVADVVSGVSLNGVGTALVALSAGNGAAERLAWLKPALVVGLALSLLVAAAAVPFLLALPAPLVPGEDWLPFLALFSGWLSVAPGLLVALQLGTGRPGRAAALIVLGLVPPVALLLWAPFSFPVIDLLAGQMAYGLAISLALVLGLRREAAVSRAAFRTLLQFVPAGLAIGIMSPAASAWARAGIAGSLSWHAAGQVQAIWRASDWVTAIMAGLLNAHFLPRLSAAADRGEFVAEIRRALVFIVFPAGLLLTVLWLLLPDVLATLYRTDIGVRREDALFFLLGDWVRVLSWVSLFGLFARRSAWAISLGEFLSLPLFALLVTVFAGQFGVREIGLMWLASYVAYAAFNFAALWRALPNGVPP